MMKQKRNSDVAHEDDMYPNNKKLKVDTSHKNKAAKRKEVSSFNDESDHEFDDES